jgi:hypothetical protein
VGRNENLTSRIQTYTTGAQVLISESTRREVGRALRIVKQLEIKAKGIEHPVTVSEVLGIAGRYKLAVPAATEALVPLNEPVRVKYAVIEGTQQSGDMFKGRLTKVSQKQGEVRLQSPVPIMTNLMMHVMDADGKRLPGELQAKVLEPVAVQDESAGYLIRFSSISPEIESFLRALIGAPPRKSQEPTREAAAPSPQAGGPGPNVGEQLTAPAPQDAAEAPDANLSVAVYAPPALEPVVVGPAVGAAPVGEPTVPADPSPAPEASRHTLRMPSSIPVRTDGAATNGSGETAPAAAEKKKGWFRPLHRP